MNHPMNKNSIKRPLHPSHDTLRLNQMNGNRQIGQAPADKQSGTGHVRFEPKEEPGESFLDTIWDVVLFLTAIVCAMGTATNLVLINVIVRPFSLEMARRLCAQYGAASFLDAVALLLPNSKIYLTGDSDIPSPVGTSVLVSNHVHDCDWFSMQMLGRCVGLRGSVKVFLRNELLQLDSGSGSPNNSARRNSPPTTVRPSMPGSMPVTLTESAPASPRASTPTSNNFSNSRQPPSADLSFTAVLLQALLDFPLIDDEDYVSNRQSLFQLLRSFTDRSGSAAPVHLLLFPEGWSVYNGEDRNAVLARSNAFALREGRPQLKHLLLPRTKGFNASLESLRDSSPVVYDVTVAYQGYDGSLPVKHNLSLFSMWCLLRRKYPEEVHFRIRRYSMEEVLQDALWLDKKWAEKDRLLNHFARHNCFPADSRGFARHRVFNTRLHSLDGSLSAMARLLTSFFSIPITVLLSLPTVWFLFWAWLLHSTYKAVFPDGGSPQATDGTPATTNGDSGQTPNIHSANPGTPFFPATPFASPLFFNWKDMLNREQEKSE